MNSVISYTRNLYPKCTSSSSVDPPAVKDGERTGKGFGLRSKRFLLVSEQWKTEGKDFRFWPREKWNESHFSRRLWLSFLNLCSQTARKRLRDQFTNKLFRMNLIEKPSQSSELPTKFEQIVSDQLKSLVLGLPPYLSLVALQKKEQKTNRTELHVSYNYCIIQYEVVT